jgi:dolichol-phosphate mannosyltransferase
MDESLPYTSIVIPTFREAENLGMLVPRVFECLADAAISGELIIVDDDSGDGTADLCDRLRRRYRVRLLTRKSERGLSTAVIHGMNHARGEVIVVMDADLSHPPEKIPELLHELASQHADFVIGSRYVKGGQVDQHWGLFRWLNSAVATALARPLTSAKDPMAGFFAIRRATFEAAAPLDPIGYKIGLELIVKCRCKQVVEVPIEFRDRVRGESKLSLRQQIDYLRHLKRLYDFRFGALARPIQFVFVGCTGMVIDLVSFSLLVNLLDFGTARALAIWLAMTWNFWLNRRLTFAYALDRHPFPQYVLFCLSCLLGATVNWGVSFTLHRFVEFFSRAKILAALCGIVAGTGFNFLMSDRLVFRRPPRDAS